MKYILLTILILALLTNGCTNSPEQITGNVIIEPNEFFCNPPYIEFKKDNCCLDMDNNNICDNHETIQEPEPIPETVEETCPFTCTGENTCKPIYKEDKIIRWTCSK